MVNALKAIIHGKVQGVGFRYYVKEWADELQLGGWVRNKQDRTVEILLTGPRDRLEQIMQYIEVGPIGSRVDHVDTHWVLENQVFEGFEITG